MERDIDYTLLLVCPGTSASDLRSRANTITTLDCRPTSCSWTGQGHRQSYSTKANIEIFSNVIFRNVALSSTNLLEESSVTSSSFP